MSTDIASAGYEGRPSKGRSTVGNTQTPVPHAQRPVFASPGALRSGLQDQDYLADDETAYVVGLAARLGKPLLVEGPAGTGKTQLAKSLAGLLGAELIRLQCYEGLDESRALFEWDYRKQLLWIQAARDDATVDLSRTFDGPSGAFDERFLLERPLLQAIRATRPPVLLIDEVDRVDVEAEALFLEVLAEEQVSVPELGTIAATSRPLVVLTSNGTRELSEALRRRCLFLYLDYPSVEREQEIVLRRCPAMSHTLAAQIAELVALLRRLELVKPPSIAETIDLAQALMLLGVADLTADDRDRALRVLIKHRADMELARKALAGAVTLP
jgi:MoxR-like ATPase